MVPFLSGADGVVIMFNKTKRSASRFLHNHPVRSRIRWLRDVYLKVADTPPLKGGEYAQPTIHSHLHRPRLQQIRHGFLKFLKFRREVSKSGGRFGDSKTPEVFAICKHLRHGFDNVVDMALSVDPARNGQSHEFHRRP
jgi:hypothetical protein